jgi:exodeoxyribonuclease V alpha subunit
VGAACATEQGLRVAFAQPGGPPRLLSPSRLPPSETVLAMTIHKSQGSEVSEVLVVLPEASSPLLVRELLYTAVTRAKSRVTLVGTEAAMRAAIDRRVMRASGLGARLW